MFVQLNQLADNAPVLLHDIGFKSAVKLFVYFCLPEQAALQVLCRETFHHLCINHHWLVPHFVAFKLLDDF